MTCDPSFLIALRSSLSAWEAGIPWCPLLIAYYPSEWLELKM